MKSKFRLFGLLMTIVTAVGCEETYIDRQNREVAVEYWVLIQPPPGHEDVECWRSYQATVCFSREE